MTLALARLALTLATVVIAGGAALAAAPEPPLSLEATIPLPDVAGRIDHMALDLGRKRLIVAELGNNTADIIDLSTRKLLHRIRNLREPQGVAYSPNADLIIITNATDGSVRFFRADDFTPAGTIALGDDADNVRIDPRDGSVLVGYGNGGLAIIDPMRRAKIANIKLPAHPEELPDRPDHQSGIRQHPRCRSDRRRRSWLARANRHLENPRRGSELPDGA